MGPTSSSNERVYTSADISPEKLVPKPPLHELRSQRRGRERPARSFRPTHTAATATSRVGCLSDSPSLPASSSCTLAMLGVRRDVWGALYHALARREATCCCCCCCGCAAAAADPRKPPPKPPPNQAPALLLADPRPPPPTPAPAPPPLAAVVASSATQS